MIVFLIWWVLLVHGDQLRQAASANTVTRLTLKDEDWQHLETGANH